MTVKNTFEINPTTNIISVLENSGYTLPTAVADIVDNCIDAKAKNIWIEFLYDGKDSKIIVIDDGIGMSKDEIVKAATYAEKSINDIRIENSLGKYSLGLKSASSTYANKLYIQSKKDSLNTILMDFKSMKDSKKWEVHGIVGYNNFLKSNTGTAIIWESIKFMQDGLSKISFYEYFENVRTHLSHVFSYFLINEEISIFANGEKLEGWDPFFTKHKKTTLFNFKNIVCDNSVIGVDVFVIPSYSSLNDAEKKYVTGKGFNEQQGFYIYRNNRLILEGGWLGLKDISVGDKFSTARIKVCIDEKLDTYFNPDFKKSSISIPDILKESFMNIAKFARKKSRENYEYIKNPQIKKIIKIDSNVVVWNAKETTNGIVLSINEDNTLIKELTRNMDEKDRKKLFAILTNHLPYGSMHNLNTNTKIDKKYYQELIEDYYNEQLQQNKMSKLEILKNIAKTEPFSLYDEWLMDFISEKGVD